MLAVGAAATPLLDDDALHRYQVRNLDVILSPGQRFQVIGPLAEHQLPEDIFILVASQHVGSVIYDTRGVDDNDTAILELRRHAVANHAQGKGFPAATTTILHHFHPSTSRTRGRKQKCDTIFLLMLTDGYLIFIILFMR